MHLHNTQLSREQLDLSGKMVGCMMEPLHRNYVTIVSMISDQPLIPDNKIEFAPWVYIYLFVMKGQNKYFFPGILGRKSNFGEKFPFLGEGKCDPFGCQVGPRQHKDFVIEYRPIIYKENIISSFLPPLIRILM